MKSFSKLRAAHEDFEDAVLELENRIDELEDEAVKWQWTATALAQMLAKFTHRSPYEILDEVMCLAENQTAPVVGKSPTTANLGAAATPVHISNGVGQ